MKLKKIVALLVLGVFLIGITASGAGASGKSFKDMDQAKWANQQVNKMKAGDIISGYNDGSFRPNQAVKQAEAVVLVVKAAGLQGEVDKLTAEVSLPYKDAKKLPLWAKKYIALAYQKGFLDGTGSFQPEKAASRQWVVKLIAKAFGLQPVAADLPYTDADKISSDAAGYVAAVVYNQLVTGFPDGSFQPNKPITRAELAVMLGLSIQDLPIPGKLHKVKGIVVSVSNQVYGQVYEQINSGVGSTPAQVYSDPNAPAPAPEIQGSITLKAEGDDGTATEVTYNVAKDAQIYVDGKAAALTDILAGVKVQMMVNKAGLVQYIEVAPVIVKAVFKAVYGDQITVIPLGKKPGEGAGKTFTVAADAPVVVNGVATTLANLLPGDALKLTMGADQKVTAINGVRFIKKIHDKKKELKDKEDKIKDRLKDKIKDKIKEEKAKEDKPKEQPKEPKIGGNTGGNVGGGGNSGHGRG